LAVTIEIAGVDRTGFVQHDSIAQIVIQKTLGEPWTCSFTTCDTNGSYYPNVGEPVVITKDTVVVYGGIVRSVNRRRVNDVIDLLWADAECTDYNHILERRLAGEYEWINKTAAEIITDIHANSLDDEGISITGIATGPTLPYFRTSYGSVGATLGQLAEETEHTLFIDAEKTLRYFAPGATAAAFDIGTAPTNLTWMQCRETDEDYCNLVIGKVGQALREPQTDSFIGDGSKTSFALAFPCATAPTVTVDGVSQTVGISSIDTGREWYWSEGSTEIRQETGSTELTAANTLEVTYSGIESIYVEAKNLTEITARATIEGSSGRYEKLLEIDRMQCYFLRVTRNLSRWTAGARSRLIIKSAQSR
jgi:hypothetical protein